MILPQRGKTTCCVISSNQGGCDRYLPRYLPTHTPLSPSPFKAALETKGKFLSVLMSLIISSIDDQNKTLKNSEKIEDSQI